ncbi:hypothetical protein [Streptococcus sp. S784/96/1]|uniref:hypothetical protein n=1 Tax=Streptococcus sp. S784/96/1 TaxID=2653499 RepID=UPI0013874844|nr:hypothetical protein [Streptococcus sp. S784/96/1]
MKTREEWCQLFEVVVGRMPTEIEILAAEKSLFNPKAILPISEGKIFEESAVADKMVTPDDDEAISVPFLEDIEKSGNTSSSHKSAEKVILEPSKEIIALPIVSFVISGLTILLSLVVKSPLLLLILSLASLTLGIVSLAVNFKKKKKILSVIALPLAIGALVIATSVGLYHATLERFESIAQSSFDADWDYSEENIFEGTFDGTLYVDSEAPFHWTEEKFKSLDFEPDTITSIITVEEVVDKYGKANEATYSDGYLTLVYSDETHSKYVDLSFVRNELGDWVLNHGYMATEAKDIKIVAEEAYKSTWTKEDFDKLIEGDYSRPELGSSWKDINSKYGKPTFAEYILSNYGDGFTRELNLYYTDWSADAGKLSDVNLTFTEKNGEYFLTYKYSE